MLIDYLHDHKGFWSIVAKFWGSQKSYMDSYGESTPHIPAFFKGQLYAVGVTAKVLRAADTERELEVKCFWSLFVCLFCVLRASPVAYGSSQDKGPIGASAPSLYHSHSNSGSKPHLRPTLTAPDNAGSPTHCARPGIEPASSGMLVGFVTAEPWRELHKWRFMGQ